jgi:hypothetical protein
MLGSNSEPQLFIRTHNETLSVVAMCVCNPDRSFWQAFCADDLSKAGWS